MSAHCDGLAADFIAPLFVVEGKGAPEEIKSMPGVFRLSINDLVKECRELVRLGVPAVALFPRLDPRLKDPEGMQALNEDTLVLRAVRAGGGTIVKSVFHAFSPWGVSGVVVITESHVTIHTWPEHSHAAVDIFSCSPDLDHTAIRTALAAGFIGTNWLLYAVSVTTGKVLQASLGYFMNPLVNVLCLGVLPVERLVLGAQAMGGGNLQIGAFCVSWPTGEFGGMGLEGKVKLGNQRAFAALATAEERIALYEKLVAEEYQRGKALNVGSLYEVDDVIDPARTRDWIVAGLRAMPAFPAHALTLLFVALAGSAGEGHEQQAQAGKASFHGELRCR